MKAGVHISTRKSSIVLLLISEFGLRKWRRVAHGKPLGFPLYPCIGYHVSFK